MQVDNKLFDDNWQVRIFRVEEVSYEEVSFESKMFPYWVVSYIAKGHLRVTDGSFAQEAGTGQVMLHAPGIPFGESSLTPGTHQWLFVQVTNSFQVDLFDLYPIPEVMTLQDPDAFADIFSKLLAAWERQDAIFRALELSGLGMQLVHLLLDNWDRAGRINRRITKRKNDERLEQVMTYLHASVKEKISRHTLAQLVHLNPSYLDKLFAGKYQMNPMEMLRELRLLKVKKMLENTDDSLADIAEACGMGDAPYLSHQFAKRFGMNPGDYRKKLSQAAQTYYRNFN
ncbi:AraC family transcriptional regulator [Paenibacillus oryzisoli]|uniref:helix-turn-helix domain-containing protein n=1 Tax=Paenibacillus oryzisoli TaxID=1850517 RepID=UPI003D2BB39B